MRSRKAQCQAPPDNSETGDTYHIRESRSCAGEKIEHQNGYKSGIAAEVRVCMYTSEANFHKTGIYGGSVRVWAAAWDVFGRAPSRVRRGGRGAVDFVVCFGLCGFLSDFFFVVNEARPRERSDRGRLLSLGKKPLRNEVRPRERSDRGRFSPLGKSFFLLGCVQAAIV